MKIKLLVEIFVEIDGDVELFKVVRRHIQDQNGTLLNSFLRALVQAGFKQKVVELAFDHKGHQVKQDLSFVLKALDGIGLRTDILSSISCTAQGDQKLPLRSFLQASACIGVSSEDINIIMAPLVHNCDMDASREVIRACLDAGCKDQISESLSQLAKQHVNGRSEARLSNVLRLWVEFGMKEEVLAFATKYVRTHSQVEAQASCIDDLRLVIHVLIQIHLRIELNGLVDNVVKARDADGFRLLVKVFIDVGLRSHVAQLRNRFEDASMTDFISNSLSNVSTNLPEGRASSNIKKAEEAYERGEQKTYEAAMHQGLKDANVVATCNTLMHGPGAPGGCSKGHGYHFWMCHRCGYAQYWGSCVNGCDWGSFGWTCISSRCEGPACGCHKGREYWREHGAMK